MRNEETPLLPNKRDNVYDRFPARQKKVLVLIASMGALTTLFTSGIFVPSIPQIVEELNSTEEIISSTVGLAMFANAVGSLIASRYSTFYGRRPIYLWWFPLLVIGSLGIARAQNVTQLMFWRIIQSLPPGLPVGAGVIGDIYKLEERGTALGIYFCTGLLGYALAPTLGGLTAYYWNWRFIHILIAAFTSVMIIIITLFFPETIHPDLKGLDVYKKSGKVPSKWRPVLLNPISQLAMLRSPNIFAVSFVNYVAMLTDFALLVPLPYTIGKRYGIENEALLGACFLPLGIGKAIGAPLAGWISDKVVIKYKKQRGYWYPEDRIRASLFGFYLPLTVFASAVITTYVPGRLGLILNFVCFFFNGVGSDILLTPCGTYVVDVLHSRSAEATAAVNTFRSIAVAASTAALLPMINTYGLIFTNFVVALITVIGIGFVLMAILTIVYGESLRAWMDIGFTTADHI